MDDAYLEQFSRHILLDEIGIEGQAAFQHAHILVVGAGGLGCPAALYLAAAGVGRLTLVDDDTVDLSNLQRQILHIPTRVGVQKVESAAIALRALSTQTTVHPVSARLDDVKAEELIRQVDLVIDCSDNFSTRYLINRVCKTLRKPLVTGAAIRFSGQLAVFDFMNTSTPCYHCLFPDGDDVLAERCAVTGIFAPVTGVIGTLLASEALKMLVRKFSTGVLPIELREFEPFFLSYNGLKTTFSRSRVFSDPECQICQPEFNDSLRGRG